jgi:hypothetical protein
MKLFGHTVSPVHDEPSSDPKTSGERRILLFRTIRFLSCLVLLVLYITTLALETRGGLPSGSNLLVKHAIFTAHEWLELAMILTYVSTPPLFS